MIFFPLVVIVDPGINIDPGYIPYDRGLQQDIYLKVRVAFSRWMILHSSLFATCISFLFHRITMVTTLLALCGPDMSTIQTSSTQTRMPTGHKRCASNTVS